MTRRVELRHYPDAPEPRVLDDVRHVLLRVHGDLLVPGALLAAIISALYVIFILQVSFSYVLLQDFNAD